MVFVGQKIFFVETDWGRKSDKVLRTATVIRVGRLNYEVQDDAVSWRTITFRKESNLDVSGRDYSDGHFYKAYLSEQEYLDEQERKALSMKIRKTIQDRLDKLTLEQLRQISAILHQGLGERQIP